MQMNLGTHTRYLAVFLATLFLGFGGLWFFSAFGRDYYMDRDYGQWSAKIQMLNACDVGEVAILGDSRASAAFVPILLRPLDVRNLALTGATPVETFFEVSRILTCPVLPHTIVLAFSPTQYQEIKWFWGHAARYGLLSYADLEDVRNTAIRLHDATLYNSSFGAEPPGPIKNRFYASGFPAYNFSSFIASGLFFRAHINARVRAETLGTQGHHLEGEASCAKTAGEESLLKTFEINPLSRSYLDRILADASAKRVTIAIATPPISDMTFRHTAPSFREGFESFIDNLRAAHPEINFIGQRLPSMEDCMFGDAYHLNRRGAEIFSKSFAIDASVAGLNTSGNSIVLSKSR